MRFKTIEKKNKIEAIRQELISEIPEINRTRILANARIETISPETAIKNPFHINKRLTICAAFTMLLLLFLVPAMIMMTNEPESEYLGIDPTDELPYGNETEHKDSNEEPEDYLNRELHEQYAFAAANLAALAYQTDAGTDLKHQIPFAISHRQIYDKLPFMIQYLTNFELFIGDKSDKVLSMVEKHHFTYRSNPNRSSPEFEFWFEETENTSVRVKCFNKEYTVSANTVQNESHLSLESNGRIYQLTTKDHQEFAIQIFEDSQVVERGILKYMVEGNEISVRLLKDDFDEKSYFSVSKGENQSLQMLFQIYSPHIVTENQGTTPIPLEYGSIDIVPINSNYKMTITLNHNSYSMSFSSGAN